MAIELSFHWSDSNTQRDSVLVPVLGIQREAAPRKRTPETQLYFKIYKIEVTKFHPRNSYPSDKETIFIRNSFSMVILLNSWMSRLTKIDYFLHKVRLMIPPMRGTGHKSSGYRAMPNIFASCCL